ncbi:protein Abitram [Pararge aegeria]|uniref:Protein Abitram n=2 Tax=Pararge aegeria TaxID=116150 RepID=A0A8S4S1S3_9NEOP|nr:protein Abitram [Pararge aegeria]CAH2245942.1 jg27803 [Pararge aegeria aegeria]
MEYNILDSIDLNDPAIYKSFTERYFSKRYLLNVNGIKNNDIMLMFHSNRITLICLAPSHFFFKKNDNYTLNFNIGKVDRLSNQVKGKGKKGGQALFPDSAICKVEWGDKTAFTIPCGMRGTLVEINEKLVKYPQLLKESPDSDGFIAIMLSSIAITDATKKELITHEEYLKIVNV